MKRISVMMLITACFVLLTACSKNYLSLIGDPIQPPIQEKQLEQSIQKVYQSKKDLILSNETKFDWDRVYIFTPYCDAKTVNKALGLTWMREEDPRTDIEYSDFINLILFTKAGKVVMYFDFPRDKSDFELEKPYSADKKNAVFKVEKMKGEGNFLILTPIKKATNK